MRNQYNLRLHLQFFSPRFAQLSRIYRTHITTRRLIVPPQYRLAFKRLLPYRTFIDFICDGGRSY